MGDVDPGAGPGAADHDRISDLPDHLLHDILIRLPCTGDAARTSVLSRRDHLLHDILIRLPCTADAARTSVLSRRWRRIWAHTPVISLVYYGEFQPESRVLDRVDAALAAHAAGTGTSTVSLSRLEITMSLPYNTARQLRSDGVAAWLLVAAQRLEGELRIRLPIYFPLAKDDDGEVLLPLCERATSISLDLNDRTLRFAPPPAAAAGGVSKFAALATLTIRSARWKPPCRRLDVHASRRLQQDDGGDLSIRSDSLEWLEISSVWRLDGGRLCLRVHAPNLQTFHAGIMCDLCVVALKLLEVRWHCSGGAYDSSHHHFAHTDHQLRCLEVEADPFGFALMRQFNTIDELELTVNIKRGVEEYERVLTRYRAVRSPPLFSLTRRGRGRRRRRRGRGRRSRSG